MKIHTIIFALYLLFCLFGCENNNTTNDSNSHIPSKPARGDAVIIGIMAEPSTLNPTNYFDETAENISHHIFQRLLDRSAHPDYDLIPMLAKDRPKISNDGLNFTFEIRDEAVWDDNQPITAQDVIFSLKVLKNPYVNAPAKRPFFDLVKEVIIDSQNPKKFTVVMKSKYMLAESTLGYELLILPQKVYDPNKLLEKISIRQLNDESFTKTNADLKAFADNYNQSKYDREPKFVVGSNAYELKEWTTKQKIVLKRKTKWWADSLYHDEALQAYPDQIIYRYFSDENGAIASIKSGDVDVLCNISPKSFVDLEKSDKVIKNYHLSAQPVYAYTYFGMNMKPSGEHPPIFTDPLTRRAMAHLLNADEIIKNLLNGQAQRVTGPFLPFQKGMYNDSLPLLRYDVTQAKKLLDEAGWKDSDNDGILDRTIDGKKIPFTFDFQIPAQNELRKAIALHYQNSLKQVGIKMNITPLEMNVYFQKQLDKDFDMFYGGWATSPAPMDLKQIFHSESFYQQGGSNNVGLVNKRLDHLIEATRTELNAEKRNKLYREMQKIIYEEQSYVFFITSLTPVIISKRFQNAEPTVLRPNYQPNAFWTNPEKRKYKPNS